MNPDPERDDTLLDAMLCDESWQCASAAFKAEALKTFRSRQRLRRLTRWGGSVAALAAIVVGLGHWLARPARAPRQIAAAPASAPSVPDKARYLTDAELIAAFPKGSCFIAEVDGRKELVFANPELAHTFLARTDSRPN
jgi:hypothetical protein